MIDADALLEAFEREQSGYEKHGREFASSFLSSGGELSTEWWCVEDLVENTPTVSEWISVEERLPEPFEVVLVAYIDTNDPYGNCNIGMTSWTGVLNHGKGTWNYYGPAIEITHWIPLPEQPEVNE